MVTLETLLAGKRGKMIRLATLSDVEVREIAAQIETASPPQGQREHLAFVRHAVQVEMRRRFTRRGGVRLF